jgi:hypothetical protein
MHDPLLFLYGDVRKNRWAVGSWQNHLKGWFADLVALGSTPHLTREHIARIKANDKLSGGYAARREANRRTMRGTEPRWKHFESEVEGAGMDAHAMLDRDASHTFSPARTAGRARKQEQKP